MHNHYYDMPDPEVPAPPVPEGTWGEAPAPAPVQPLYEETAGPGRPRRRGLKGTLIFCGLVALIAAGLIALAVINDFGVLPTLDLDRLPDSSFDFDFDFDFGEGWDTLPGQVETRPETTIERAPTGGNVPLVLHGVEDSEELSYQQVYRKVLPSVVSVQVTNAAGTGGAQGTGVVLSEDGYIVTNFHIIEGSAKAQVVLENGRTYTARLVGGDSASDLAVLKIPCLGLTPAQLGDSDLLQVGDLAFAIGNPLGEQFRGTMTDGIVSAINRDVNTDGVTMTLIQTTAALNKGNSGGALVNIRGQVVGITNMKMTSDYDTIEGLGFAIPTATVKAVAEELIAHGHIGGRPTLGVTVRALVEGERERYRLPQSCDGGILIVEIQGKSGAAEQGLQVGDIIVEAGGRPIRANEDLLEAKSGLDVGDVLVMKVWREDGFRTFRVPLVDLYQLDNVK